MIKEMRLENGMTQKQLAEKLETKKSVISRMETILKISDCLPFKSCISIWKTA